MKNKITANIGLKIMSLIFAFILWLVVNNIDNPTQSLPYTNIPVTLINTELITDSGQVYEVLDGTDVVERVIVRAPRTVHSALNAENIIAVADVSELSSLDTISIKFSTDLYNNEIESMKGSIDTVKLNIEDKRTKTLALTSIASGEPESGYLVGDITPDQNLVRISGPESVISQVAKAVVEVGVSGFTVDIDTNEKIQLYDAEDNLIQDTRITQNIKSVGVKVNIYQTAEVPLVFNTSGTTAAGYRATGVIQGSIETVTLAAKSSILRNISSVEIPAEALDITGRSEDFVTDITIGDYLPENTFLADPLQNKVTVTVYIQPETSKKLEIREERVEVTNVPEGYQATIAGLEESFIIEVIGLSSEISDLRASDIKGTVDIAQWMLKEEMEEPEEGYYTVEVDFGLPERVSLLEPISVTMHLSKREE